MGGNSAFDSFMDGAEDFVDMLAGKKTPPAVSTRPPAPTSAPMSNGSALPAVPVTITEAIDADTGAAIFIVRQGHDKAECFSSAFARRIKNLLEQG